MSATLKLFSATPYWPISLQAVTTEYKASRSAWLSVRLTMFHLRLGSCRNPSQASTITNISTLNTLESHQLSCFQPSLYRTIIMSITCGITFDLDVLRFRGEATSLQSFLRGCLPRSGAFNTKDVRLTDQQSFTDLWLCLPTLQPCSTKCKYSFDKTMQPFLIVSGA